MMKGKNSSPERNLLAITVITLQNQFCEISSLFCESKFNTDITKIVRIRFIIQTLYEFLLHTLQVRNMASTKKIPYNKVIF